MIANHAESGNKNSATITTNSDGYIWFIFSNNFDKINQILDICEYIQIEYGTQATTYEPHKSNILTVNEEVELRGIGEVQDTLNCLTGEVVQNIGEIVLDGSENYWSLDTTKEITQVFKANNSVMDKLTTNNNFYCNYFINQAGDTEKLAFAYASLYLALNKTTASTLQELKTWLSTHNTIVYYVLATPTTTEITDTELINQLESIE